MAPIQLYGMQLSAPCRLVQMTADVVGVEFDFKTVDLMAGEHMKPEYLAINPQHNLPAIVDGELKLNESRAIAAYLVNMYGGDKKETLLPSDPKIRAIVDQRMYFDMGTFYKAFGDCVYPVLFGTGEVTDKERERLAEVLGWVNCMVKEDKFIAGTDHMTLADISNLATCSTLHAAGLLDGDKFPNIVTWFNKMKNLIPNYEKMDGEGAAMFGGFYKSKVVA